MFPGDDGTEEADIQTWIDCNDYSIRGFEGVNEVKY